MKSSEFKPAFLSLKTDLVSHSAYGGEADWIYTSRDFMYLFFKKTVFFFPSSGHVHITVKMHHLDADKARKEKAWRQLHKDSTSYIKQILEATSHKTASLLQPTTHLKDHPN